MCGCEMIVGSGISYYGGKLSESKLQAYLEGGGISLANSLYVCTSRSVEEMCFLVDSELRQLLGGGAAVVRRS